MCDGTSAGQEIAGCLSKIVFASELKAIPEPIRGEVDLNALNYYLALGYIPNSLCIARGVTKLPPGHAARYEFFSINEEKLERF